MKASRANKQAPLSLVAAASEAEALLYLSQQAPRARVRQWLAETGGAQEAFARYGKAPAWPIAEVESLGYRVATSPDAAYPPLLRHIPDPPLALYYVGELAPPPGPCVAVVGSRRCTRPGSRLAESFGRELAEAGGCVISGLARGVDGAAHRGALASGAQGGAWAVLGSGLKQIYPREHRTLAERIVASGGVLLSEYMPDVRPLPHNFPERNRIISGLAAAVVVVEASRRSGSLITARMAGEQGRDLFAVPGPVSSPVSAGCHWLIRQGAELVESAADVLTSLGYEAPAKAAPEEPPQRLAPVFNELSGVPLPVDEIAIAAGVAVEAATSDLVQLELLGFVELTPDGYIRALR